LNAARPFTRLRHEGLAEKIGRAEAGQRIAMSPRHLNVEG